MNDVMVLLEAAGALLLSIAVFFLYSVSGRLKELSDAVGQLRLEIAKEYVLKTEFTAHEDRVHDLTDSLGVISNRLTSLEVTFSANHGKK